jgi:HAE1 family hydrophobic/amphiphilic exporter-1
MLSFVLTLIATALLYTAVPKDFLPSGDTGQIIASTEGPQDISFPAMMQRQRAVAEIVAADPSVRTLAFFRRRQRPAARPPIPAHWCST